MEAPPPLRAALALLDGPHGDGWAAAALLVGCLAAGGGAAVDAGGGGALVRPLLTAWHRGDEGCSSAAAGAVATCCGCCEVFCSTIAQVTPPHGLAYPCVVCARVPRVC